mgnify:CR=1 FL=1
MKCEWITCELGKLLTFQRGYDLPRTSMVEGRYPVIGSNGIIGYHNEYTTEAPSVSIGRSGNVGKPFIYYGRTWSHNTTLYVKDFKDSDPVFIFYLLKSLDLGNFAGGSAVPTLNRNHIHNLNVFVPKNKIDQRRIGSCLKLFDDKIELNNKINANLEQQAQALFKAWFVDFEPFGGKMPEDWSESSLAGIAHYLNGLAMQKYRPRGEDGSIPVLKIKELRQGHWDAASDRCSAKIPSEYIIHDGDVIFSWSGSLLVDFWCGGKCGLNQHLFKVTSSHYDTWFFYSWTKYHLARFIAIAADKATTMGHIKRDALEDAKVLIPSEWDYQMLGNILAPMYRKIVCNRIENRKLARLRDMLLQRLMSGEIGVSDISFPKL